MLQIGSKSARPDDGSTRKDCAQCYSAGAFLVDALVLCMYQNLCATFSAARLWLRRSEYIYSGAASLALHRDIFEPRLSLSYEKIAESFGDFLVGTVFVK
jgi:hypothetical protein